LATHGAGDKSGVEYVAKLPVVSPVDAKATERAGRHRVLVDRVDDAFAAWVPDLDELELHRPLRTGD
jgi:hypothetical protein